MIELFSPRENEMTERVGSRWLWPVPSQSVSTFYVVGASRVEDPPGTYPRALPGCLLVAIGYLLKDLHGPWY